MSFIKKFISLLLVCSILAVSATATADPSPVTVAIPPAPDRVYGEKDVGAAASPMHKLQIAPFTGVLLSPLALATLLAEIDSFDARLKLETARVASEESAKCEFKVSEVESRAKADVKVAQAQLDEKQRMIDTLNGRLKKTEDDRPNTPLWVGLGVSGGLILGVLLTVVVTYGVNQATK